MGGIFVLVPGHQPGGGGGGGPAAPEGHAEDCGVRSTSRHGPSVNDLRPGGRAWLPCDQRRAHDLESASRQVLDGAPDGVGDAEVFLRLYLWIGQRRRGRSGQGVVRYTTAQFYAYA